MKAAVFVFGRVSGLALLILAGLGCVHSATETQHPQSAATGPQPSPNPTQTGTLGQGLVSPPPPNIALPEASPKPLSVRVRVTVRSSPGKSTVYWGKKKLGDTPVQLDRPRDSGPVDLIVRRVGYFPFHTRAYTFRNDTVYAKLTRLADRMTLFGAKEEPPPGPPPSPGPGVPVPAVAGPAPSAAPH